MATFALTKKLVIMGVIRCDMPSYHALSRHLESPLLPVTDGYYQVLPGSTGLPDDTISKRSPEFPLISSGRY
eukprot:773402-Amorphochlora_amoeboformis.AAC.1